MRSYSSPAAGSNSRSALLVSRHKGGIGHVSRSLAIAETLAGAGWDVTHLAIGPEIPGGLMPRRGIRQLVFPVIDPGEDALDEACNLMASILERFRPRLVVTELYPFSGHRLEKVVAPLLTSIRRSNDRLRLVCAMRDIPVTDHAQPLVETASVINAILCEYYDEVWHHTDERLCCVEDVLGLEAAVKGIPVRTTGYVVRRRPACGPERRFDLLASGGAGAHASLLFSCLAGALQEHRDRFGAVHAFPGPFLPDAALDAFERGARSEGLTVHRRTANLWANLAKCERVLCMGGANTLLEALFHRRPTAVVTRRNSYEQNLRAALMAKAQLVELVHEETISVPAIMGAIEALRYLRPSIVPRSDGAKRCALLAEALVT